MAHLCLTKHRYPDIISHPLQFGKPSPAIGAGGYQVGTPCAPERWPGLSGREVAHGMEVATGGVMLQSTD